MWFKLSRETGRPSTYYFLTEQATVGSVEGPTAGGRYEGSGI